MLEIKNLRAWYDGKEALRGLSFQVADGGCVCLLGANGAGKTTTMRCVSGLLAPTAGEITFVERLDEEYPTVCLYGAGHVGRALAGMLVQLPLRLQWLDSRTGQFPPQAVDYSRVLPEPELIGSVAAAAAVTSPTTSVGQVRRGAGRSPTTSSYQRAFHD